MLVIDVPYTNLNIGNQSSCMVADHMGGFDSSLHCHVLDQLATTCKAHCKVSVEYILDKSVKNNYPQLDLTYDSELWTRCNFIKDFQTYNIHPILNFKNFVCSFNGAPHVGRKLLVSILKKFNYFNPVYCSKNFSYSISVLDGHIYDYINSTDKFYRKFFISHDSEEFFRSTSSFGHVQYNHKQNIYTLEDKLTESFLHIVSETMSTSYVPFVTEKFLYSVVTRGLFLAYAQPGWHAHLEKYYGFKRYTKLFDYRFDAIKNPVERLIELMSMISKFSVLSSHDWQDLYLLEQDTIEYNYNHYYSQDYLKCLAKYS